MGSWLFIPGSNERALRKIDLLNAKKIIIDLEDAVPLNEKAQARENVKETLKNVQRKCFVRINDTTSGLWEEDVKSIFHENLEGIVLAKAESKKDIKQLKYLIDEEEEKHQLEKGTVKIFPLIESAMGVFNAHEIATSDSRVSRLLFGAVDYSLDLNLIMSKTGEELLYARSYIVLASKVAGVLPPIDTVYIDIENIAGLEDEAHRAKEIGFKGKLVIHPKQIEAVNVIFEPTKEEVRLANEIVEVFNKNNFKTIKYKDIMIDKPVYNKAMNIIKESNGTY